MRAPFSTTLVDLMGGGKLGSALAAGSLVATVKGSTGHITVRVTPKRQGENSRRYQACAFTEATLLDVAVPGADGEGADKIGTAYPLHSSNRWAGTFFRDQAQSDDRRWKAALYVLAAAAGQNNGTHVEQSVRCYRCNVELTTPQSIAAGFGEHCAGEVGAFHSGNEAHEAKVKAGARGIRSDSLSRPPVAPRADLPPTPTPAETTPIATISYGQGDDPYAALAALTAQATNEGN